MGEVWQALDMPADRLVALKFIRPELLNNAQVRTRFANEAKTLGKLEQDRIVPLYAVVEEGDTLAFALRYIDGQPLSDRIDSQGPQSEKFALTFSRDILTALGYAHEHNVIHRDIKPQNILVTKQDQCFLTDFGIAVAGFLERATVGSFAIGTPHYMSPEQIMRPRDITIANGGQRSDIYSFGVVLFEVLTGQVPFGQDTNPDEIFTVQQAHCQQQPPAPRSLNSAVSPAMENIVLWCMEKDANRRPQSCGELLAEIEAAISQPASGPSLPRRAGVATIVESLPGTQTVIPAAPQSAEVALPRRGRRNLIVASSVLAAVAAVSVVGILVERSPQKSPGSSSPPAVTDPRPVSSLPPATNTAQAKPSEASQSPHTRAVELAPKQAALPPRQNPQTQAPVHPSEGVTLANEAAGQYQDGDYCTALGTLDRAIAVDPTYSSRRPGYKNACDHSRTD
jgi:serine/threonine-protein kinase